MTRILMVSGGVLWIIAAFGCSSTIDRSAPETPELDVDPRGVSHEFEFAGFHTRITEEELAARYPGSKRSGGHFRISEKESHDHVHTVSTGSHEGSGRVRVGFEKPSEGVDASGVSLPPTYPACAPIAETLETRYGPPTELREFWEERMKRADRRWRRHTQLLELICFSDGGTTEYLAEAVILSAETARFRQLAESDRAYFGEGIVDGPLYVHIAADGCSLVIRRATSGRGSIPKRRRRSCGESRISKEVWSSLSRTEICGIRGQRGSSGRFSITGDRLRIRCSRTLSRWAARVRQRRNQRAVPRIFVPSAALLDRTTDQRGPQSAVRTSRATVDSSQTMHHGPEADATLSDERLSRLRRTLLVSVQRTRPSWPASRAEDVVQAALIRLLQLHRKGGGNLYLNPS